MDRRLDEALLKGDLPAFLHLVEEDDSVVDQRVPRSLNTSLHVASKCCHKELVAAMVERWPEMVLMENARMETPLHEACLEGHLEVCMMLLEADPSVAYKRNGDGESVLFVACGHGHLDVVRLLLKQSPLLLISEEDGLSTSLHAAVSGGFTDIVREILSIRQDFAWRRDGQGLTPLHIAATKGHLEITREFLKIDADLCFVKDNDGRSPLHAAAIKGRVAILDEILSASLDSASLVTNQGETILHLCVKNNQYDALRYLVEKLDITRLINLPDDNGNTVLHLATAGKLSVILGTGMDTQDTSPSVLLFFDKQRFIFNAGEGLQRFCTEHKLKLSKIDHMFLTRVCSETAGGLPGLLLTLAGIGDEGMTVNVWGPSDLKYLVDAMRSFIPKAAVVHTHSFGSASRPSDAGTFTDPIVLIDDEVVKISAILLRPSCSNTLNSAAGMLEENWDQLLEPVAPSSQSSPGEEGTELKPGDISVIYICELPEIKGKFDPAKAVALGLKAGPKYRELQLGNSVMSDRQKIMVHPSDVLGPSTPGPIVLLVDCPSLSHLQEMLSVQTLSDYFAENVDRPQKGVKCVNCVIHLGPASVTMTPNYQKWMKRFGKAQHIMAGHEMKNMEIPILKSSARIASKLNYLCPQFFPGPDLWSHEHLNHISQSSAASSQGSSLMLCDSIPAENLLKFHLRPYAQLGLDRSGVPNLVTRIEIVDELLAEIPEIEDASKHISQFWYSSGKAIGRASHMQDNIIMIEEPWINGNACISNTNLANEATDASEETSTSNDSSATDFKHEPKLPSCLENISREDMEIVLLGTGSSQPSKYRNVSSIYINLFSKGSLLLDCGEGTLAQLKRRFGVKGADDAVRGLRCVWISHMHADHHTGLARVLSWRCELLRGIPHEPLLVIGPRPLKRFLDAYSRLEDLDMQFLDCRHTTESTMDALAGSLDSNGDCLPSTSNVNDGTVNRIGGRVEGQGFFSSQKNEATLFAKGSQMQSYWKRPGSPVESAVDLLALKKLKRVLLEAGLEAMVSVPVVHCPQAFGVVLQAAERINNVGKTIPGWKLVYSGDTRPCQALVDASLGATVLIHEATFEDGMMEEAVARNHSVTKEAIEVGASAGVYRIILTHFSQRYPKIPVFDATHMDKTCIAFDMMSINVADLPILPKVVPHLTLLFRNEMVVDESDDIPVSVQNP